MMHRDEMSGEKFVEAAPVVEKSLLENTEQRSSNGASYNFALYPS